MALFASLDDAIAHEELAKSWSKEVLRNAAFFTPESQPTCQRVTTSHCSMSAVTYTLDWFDGSLHVEHELRFILANGTFESISAARKVEVRVR